MTRALSGTWTKNSMMPPPCDDDSGEICDLDMPELVSDVPETTSVCRPVVYTDVTEAFLAGSSGGFVAIYTGRYGLRGFQYFDEGIADFWTCVRTSTSLGVYTGGAGQMIFAD
mmetsp:Transcript_90513/g.207162  ORF Transcript_90513/g.207162 Transcript_90513/m.207162 type:complete len:113 (+) Transcript_90513:223-561(+)